MNPNRAPMSALNIIVLIGIYLAVELCLKAGIMFFFPFAGQAKADPALAKMLREDGIVAVLLLVAVVGPIIEEILFRLGLYNVIAWLFGAVLRLIINHRTAVLWGQYVAVVLSAIAFALAHEEIMWQLFTMHMIFGLFAADLYRRTGHLGAPMALHMTNNLISYML